MIGYKDFECSSLLIVGFRTNHCGIFHVNIDGSVDMVMDLNKTISEYFNSKSSFSPSSSKFAELSIENVVFNDSLLNQKMPLSECTNIFSTTNFVMASVCLQAVQYVLYYVISDF